MNLFLPYPDDLHQSAAFLDDGRLNKQVVEAYQIGNVILRTLSDPSIKAGWRNHPSTLAVLNDGRPKFPWLKRYIEAMNAEWVARGFNRSDEFLQKIELLFQRAEEEHGAICSAEPVLTFVGGGEVFVGDAELVGEKYRQYLSLKFENSKTKPRWTPRKI